MDFSIQKYLRTSRERKSDFKRLILIGSKISLQKEPPKTPRKMCKIQDQGTMGSYQFWGRLYQSIPAFSRDICSILSLNSHKLVTTCKCMSLPSIKTPPHTAWPNLGGSATSAQLFLKKRKILVNKRLGHFFYKWKTNVFWATTLVIEFNANLIIPINYLGDFFCWKWPQKGFQNLLLMCLLLSQRNMAGVFCCWAVAERYKRPSLMQSQPSVALKELKHCY